MVWGSVNLWVGVAAEGTVSGQIQVRYYFCICVDELRLAFRASS